jgi:hypothetical protein
MIETRYKMAIRLWSRVRSHEATVLPALTYERRGEFTMACE